MKEIKLPKNWKIEKVSNIANLIRGINYKKETASNNSFFESLPILRANNINGDLNFEDLVYVPKSLIKSEQLIKKDDIIFAMSSGSKHLVGKTAVAKNDFKGSYGAFCALLRINEGINKKYVSYIFKGNNYRKLISEIAKGTSINNLKREHILDFEFPLPPLETQHAIVSKIEELFSELDKGIAELKTAQQQLKTYRQSVLKSAFEGKLTNENVKDGELPEGWKLKNLGEIFKVSSGKGIKINQLKGGDYCVYGGNGLNGYHSEYFIEESVLIIGRVGVKCGVTHITKPKGWVSDNALIVKPIIEDFDIKFFKLRLEFENLNKLSVSTAQPVISGNSIYSVQVFLPKLEEQYRIVQEIESRLSVADKMEQSIHESLQKAEALRQSILKKAFCGELV